MTKKGSGSHPVVELIFDEMRRQRLTLESVALESGVSRAAIHAWPANGNPKLTSLAAVAEVLGLEIVARSKSK